MELQRSYDRFFLLILFDYGFCHNLNAILIFTNSHFLVIFYSFVILSVDEFWLEFPWLPDFHVDQLIDIRDNNQL